MAGCAPTCSRTGTRVVASRIYGAMTYKQTKARIPKQELPDFWVGGMAKLNRQLAKVRNGKVEVIAACSYWQVEVTITML